MAAWAPTATADNTFYEMPSADYPDGRLYGPDVASAFDPDQSKVCIIGVGAWVRGRRSSRKLISAHGLPCALMPC